MTNLQILKQEAREEMGTAYHFTSIEQRDEFLSSFADRLVDEIEKAVVKGKYWTNYEYDPEYENGWNAYDKEVREAFTRFKGESV